MKQHSFFFKLEDIHEKVYERTSLIARSRKVEGILPDEMILHRQHDTIFKELFAQAASDILDALSGYARSTGRPQNVEDESYDNGSWFVALQMPDSFNTEQAPAVNTEIKNALINHILSKWLMMAKPDEALIYGEYYDKNITNILFKLSARTKVVRTPFYNLP
ncbi:MAG: hypothetical protein LBR26_15930 [Prevotella sp.]|jgi:hypothetical protein|nr:hypothetical protein [Prevotella sp.]